jgi:beta-galactosidase
MRHPIFFIFIFLIFIQNAFSQIKAGRNQSFDYDWKFQKGNNIDANKANFNDKNWRKLDVPHDWSIEDLTENPTDSVIGLSSRGPFSKKSIDKNSTGFTVGGSAWHRKHFILDKSTTGKLEMMK